MRTTLAAICLILSTAPAFAKSYTAERFDSRIEVLAGGSLRVTETLVFRFEDGTFTEVFRTIPRRNTDGVEFRGAAMDGVPMPEGTGPGHVKIRQQNGLRITWMFAPTGPSTHTYTLDYVVLGVARREDGRDLLGWRALPSEHAYRIEASRIEVLSPEPLAAPPSLEMRRVGQYDIEDAGARVIVQAGSIGKNGWIEVWLPYATGRIIAQPPAWQQRREHYRQFRNPSLAAAAMVLFAGFMLLLVLKQGYDAPPADVQLPHAFSGPPDTLAAPLAGALVTNGRPQLEHAMAAVFSLASRGILTIEEEAHGWLSSRRYTIARGSHRQVAPHETAALDIIFGQSQHDGGRVELQKARGLMVRRFSTFKAAVLQELEGEGLLDDSRRRLQSRYVHLAIGLVATAVLATAPIVLLLDRYGPWVLLVPAAVLLLALAAAMFAAALTPLSNDGVRRAAQWRAYRTYLRQMAKEATAAHPAGDLLPVAIALGLAVVWSKMFKQRGMAPPPWFHAAANSDAHTGFVAFVAYGGSGASAHGGAGGAGAAAGGGASGAS